MAKSKVESKPKNTKEVKKRKEKAQKKAEYKKTKEEKEKSLEEIFKDNLNSVRNLIPTSILNVELVSRESNIQRTLSKKGKVMIHDLGIVELIKASNAMRNIRNTVLGKVYKCYKNMIRTNEYKDLSAQNSSVKAQIAKLVALEEKNELEDKGVLELRKLRKAKEDINEKFNAIQKKYNVTKSYCEKYAKDLRTSTFPKLQAVLAQKSADRAWVSMSAIMLDPSKTPNFLKADFFPTLEGKQAERCIILKYKEDKENKGNGEFVLSYNKFEFTLKYDNNDLFVKDTLFNIKNYLQYGNEIDKVNVERYLDKKQVLSTGRVLYNRIKIVNKRGRIRIFLQTVLESAPAMKKKKDGSPRHVLGKGKGANDCGTQSFAAVIKDEVILKNLSERSENSLKHEKAIAKLNRAMERSKIDNNKDFFNKDGTYKKRKDRPQGFKMFFSNKYKKKKELRRKLYAKAADSRKYAANEDVNMLRSKCDLMITEVMNYSALQKRAKKTTINKNTGKINKKKRYGKSIARRCPGYFLSRLKKVFESTGGTYQEVNNWTFKASQFDHILNDCSKKSLSKRWHILPNGIWVQRDVYSAFLMYCSNADYSSPDIDLCNQFFETFIKMHDNRIEYIKENKIKVLNSGIKIA